MSVISWCSFQCLFFFFFKQKTAYEMRISDWSSDVCSSDLDMSCAASNHKRLLWVERGRPRQFRQVKLEGWADGRPAPCWHVAHTCGRAFICGDRKSVV